MSRCFPYPPPGFARTVARTEPPLIESIKLQSERQQSKADRKKERSRDKKHRSKERKEKSSRGCLLDGQNQKKSTKEAKKLLEGATVEAEQLEKSGLTEEHGQPVWPQSPGYLSDGTQTNHKRKRNALSPNEGCKSSDGTQIPHKRKRDVLPPNEGCKASDGTQILHKRKRDSLPPSKDCKSSDVTRINDKRESDALPSPNEGCKLGKIIRIKLGPLNHREDSSLSKEPTCSTSGRDSPLDQKRDVSSRGPRGPIQQKTGFTNSDTVIAFQDDTFEPKIIEPRLVYSIDNICSQVSSREPIHKKTGGSTNCNTILAAKDATSKPMTKKEPRLVHSMKITSSQVSGHEPIQQKTGFTSSDSVSTVKYASKPEIKEPRLVHSIKDMSSRGNVVSLPSTRSPAESTYEALFEKWVPPPIELESHMDDEDWLFGETRQQDGHTAKTSKAFSHVPSCRSSSLWPREQYLPDADVYSLPYTIPF